MTTRQRINRALDRLESLQAKLDLEIVGLLRDLRGDDSRQPSTTENLGKLEL